MLRPDASRSQIIYFLRSCEFCPRDTRTIRHPPVYIFGINDRGIRAASNDRFVQICAHIQAQLSTGASAKPTGMQRDPGVRKRSHETCTAAHDNKQPDSALWPRHCSASKQAALQNNDRPGQNRNQRPSSLAAAGHSRTEVATSRPAYKERRKAHSAWSARGIMGAKPGRGSNGAAPVAITAVRQRRLAGQQLLSKVDGDHLGEEAIRALQNRLRTRSQAA